mmetsp:Transcript_36413/g.45504  ORF Transcript_36413/g.45504 Transcript_36413/m.45504 type:complete len:80 (+) Transcript_36413:372-611(+)
MIPVATRNFTALISFDYKNEEITGRGITASIDAKLCFDMLKFVITEYQSDILQYNTVVPVNKKNVLERAPYILSNEVSR